MSANNFQSDLADVLNRREHNDRVWRLARTRSRLLADALARERRRLADLRSKCESAVKLYEAKLAAGYVMSPNFLGSLLLGGDVA